MDLFGYGILYNNRIEIRPYNIDRAYGSFRIPFGITTIVATDFNPLNNKNRHKQEFRRNDP